MVAFYNDLTLEKRYLLCLNQSRRFVHEKMFGYNHVTHYHITIIISKL